MPIYEVQLSKSMNSYKKVLVKAKTIGAACAKAEKIGPKVLFDDAPVTYGSAGASGIDEKQISNDAIIY